VNPDDKYDALAEGFSEREYADPQGYAAERARVIVEVGPRLGRGDTVIDLGCADAIMAGPLVERGLVYTGLDASERMIEAARARHPGSDYVVARMEEYRPAEPFDAVICLRSFYQPADRVAFFRGVAGYARKKFVFDFHPRVYAPEALESDLRAAGFTRIEMHPFFVPQRHRMPGIAVDLLVAAERAGRVATAMTRLTGIVFCSASV
jgi:SAM-dependent methyltransferase